MSGMACVLPGRSDVAGAADLAGLAITGMTGRGNRRQPEASTAR